MSKFLEGPPLQEAQSTANSAEITARTTPRQDPEEPTQSDANPSNSLDQHHVQMMSPVEMDVDEERDDRRTDASCASDLFDI